ncbi:MAG TPA: Type 1 glutamine amidotransferase-like domain-containing protein [Ktedonobacteraceae bacterium]|nr:Type 1 glutamine amidotransferase-like domain-containing protein [Ktedonobacteraceae bacterium]
MRRILLFSHVTEEAQRRVFPLLFPDQLSPKVFACMPANGALHGRSYELFCDSWQAIAQQHHAEFVYIDNAQEDAEEERVKLQRANILCITGGNACLLLRNLRRSGLDRGIKDFARKEQYVLAGYSAGAMVLTPTVRLAAWEPFNENREVGLTTFEALGLVNYEVFPHYSAETQAAFERYRCSSPNLVKPLTDDAYICLDSSENAADEGLS